MVLPTGFGEVYTPGSKAPIKSIPFSALRTFCLAADRSNDGSYPRSAHLSSTKVASITACSAPYNFSLDSAPTINSRRKIWRDTAFVQQNSQQLCLLRYFAIRRAAISSVSEYLAIARIAPFVYIASNRVAVRKKPFKVFIESILYICTMHLASTVL